MSKTIGIDLGTTNSVVAIHEGKETKVIVNSEGARLTPSVVGFSPDGRIVGRAAKGQAVTNPTKTIFSIKRFMGRRHAEVASEEKIVPFKIVGAAEDLVRVDIDGKLYAPPEISAMILQDLKKSAEAYLNEPVKDAVITVPAYFNDAQRQATKEAGQIAGLNVKRIINEPTAAALAYGLDGKKDGKIAIFDLGGGTFDISILDVKDGVFEVLSTNGDTHLGGDDWDRVLVDHVADEFQKVHRFDLRKDPMALQRLTEACEKAKCDLSSMPQTTIALPYISADQNGPKHLQTTITRATFENICNGLFEKCRTPVVAALKDAGLSPDEIDEVVLVGGATRMPKAQEICKSIFNGKEPHKGVNPDEVVAVGAAIQGAVLGGEIKDIVLLDVTPLSLGVETLGGVMTVLIPRNTTIPTKKEEIFSTASDSQPAVDVHVLQGERRMSADNRTLGRFQLTEIPPAPRGLPQIAVTFDIDVNGIISVSARDKATNKQKRIEIKSSSGLQKEEIARMVKEAEEHAEEDKKRQELVEARNRADQLCYNCERAMKDFGDAVSEERRKKIESGIEDVRRILAKKMDYEGLAEAARKLEAEMHKASIEANDKSSNTQENQSQQPQTQPQQPQAKPAQDQRPGQNKKIDDDIVEADFRMVDDK